MAASKVVDARRVVELGAVLDRLAKFANEFNEVCGDDPEKVRVNFALVLDDFCRIVLALDDQDTRRVMGDKLYLALQGGGRYE